MGAFLFYLQSMGEQKVENHSGNHKIPKGILRKTVGISMNIPFLLLPLTVGNSKENHKNP